MKDRHFFKVLGKFLEYLLIFVLFLCLISTIFIYKWYVYQIVLALIITCIYYFLRSLVLRMKLSKKSSIILNIFGIIIITPVLIIIVFSYDLDYGKKLPKFEISETYNFKFKKSWGSIYFSDNNNLYVFDGDEHLNILDDNLNDINKIELLSTREYLIQIKDERIIYLERKDNKNTIHIFDSQGNIILNKDTDIEFEGSFLDSQGEMIYYTNKDFYKVSTDGEITYLYTIDIESDSSNFYDIKAIDDGLIIIKTYPIMIYKLDKDRQVVWEKQLPDNEYVENIVDDVGIITYNHDEDCMYNYNFENGEVLKEIYNIDVNDVYNYGNDIFVVDYDLVSIYDKDLKLINQNIINFQFNVYDDMIIGHNDKLYVLTNEGSYKLKEVNIPKTIYLGRFTNQVYYIVIPALWSGLISQEKQKKNNRELTIIE